MRLPALPLAVFALAAAAPAAAANAAHGQELYEIALRRLPFARCQPGRPGASRRLRPQGGLGGELQLLDRGQERDRRLGGEDARRLADQPAGADPRPTHELPRRVARGSRRHHRLLAPAIGQVSAGAHIHRLPDRVCGRPPVCKSYLSRSGWGVCGRMSGLLMRSHRTAGTRWSPQPEFQTSQ